MSQDERPLEWIGSSRKDPLKLPADVRKQFGYALHFAQHGGQHHAAKVLKGFGGAKWFRTMEAVPTALFTRLGLKRLYSSFIASRKRAKAGSLHQKTIWISSEPASRLRRFLQRR